MRATDFMKEGWVSFQRTYCLDGFIDRAFLDAASDPNEKSQSNISLNSVVNYYRLNESGKWQYRGDFRRSIDSAIAEFREIYSSIEIWEYAMSK